MENNMNTNVAKSLIENSIKYNRIEKHECELTTEAELILVEVKNLVEDDGEDSCADEFGEFDNFEAIRTFNEDFHIYECWGKFNGEDFRIEIICPR